MQVTRLTRRLIHLRQVAQHIDQQLDSALKLGDLADIAHLSRFHFERVFAHYAGESPLTRVRRLRLLRARQRIEQGEVSSLLELALDSGYNSPEAFSRAFRAQFGCAPSQWPRAAAPETPRFRVTHLPAFAIQYIPFRGSLQDSLHPFDELRARAMLQDIPRERRKGWCVQYSGLHAGETVELHAALLSERLGTRIKQLSLGELPGGEYAVISLQGSYALPDPATLAARILQDTGRRAGNGPLLRSFHNASYLPAEFEKRSELYVPLAS
ncbi:AraC family transcriptional regulator [Uliginosibacterium sediminicola]|uniref:AraC family transcriptional regulator n=1 Tax=Uliginosibacterium sediminicola TaxID=2024550 RepID=A0ABU9Z2U5_9RHOO